MTELLSAPEELAYVRTLPGRATAHRSTVMRARRDPTHPAYQRPDGTFVNEQTTSSIEGLAVVVRAPKDAIVAFWAPRRRGPKPTRTPQEQQEATGA